MRKPILYILIFAFLLALLLPGCGSSPEMTAPRVMVNGYLYYSVGARPAEALPEGYELAGTLERVRHQPREDMTAQNVAEGAELYVNPNVPEAVYVRVRGRDSYSLYKLDFLPPTAYPKAD